MLPELRRRGLFRTEYEGPTLRETLGLPRKLGVERRQQLLCGRLMAGITVGTHVEGETLDRQLWCGTSYDPLRPPGRVRSDAGGDDTVRTAQLIEGAQSEQARVAGPDTDAHERASSFVRAGRRHGFTLRRAAAAPLLPSLCD